MKTIVAVEILKTLCSGINVENLIKSTCIYQNLIKSTCFYLKISQVHMFFVFQSSPHVFNGYCSVVY